MQTLISNISELITMEPLVNEQRFTQIKNSDLGILKNAWLLIEDGKVSNYGTMDQLPNISCEQVDANHCLVMPGLIDSHTHPVFAGSRHNEFAMRLDGKSYQDIAAMGGGISSTVSFTKNATNQELKSLVSERLNTFLAKGVTTVEVKSGYGLTPTEEIRALSILKELNSSCPQELVSTCLALHALPKEFKENKIFIDQTIMELLPEVSNNHLAEYVDAFIETGYFSVEECEPYIQKAQELGLGVRIHADEFSDAGAAKAAAKWNAASADHLQCASQEGLAAMGEANVVATLLPGTSLYTNIPYTKAKPFIEAGCPIALATDYNPGSCLVDNLPMIATLGALHCGLSTAQAIAAVTFVPALSLNRSHFKGALAVGFDADFIIFKGQEATEWLADMGRTLPHSVWIRGEKVVGNS